MKTKRLPLLSLLSLLLSSLLSLLLLLLVAPVALVAQAPAAATPPPAPQSLETQAGERFQAKDWSGAAAAYGTLATQHPESGIDHYRLGVAELYLNQLEKGLAELETAEKLGWPVPQVAYRKACAHAAAGRAERAIAELERAAAAGFAQISMADAEPLLAKLRSDSRWQAVRTSIDRAAHPCKYDAKYRAFDYWIGEWDVRPAGAPESTPPAENIVTREYDDCVVHEHWKSPNSSGESYNIYDVSRDQWFQTWVDNTGGLHQYHGNLNPKGDMVFLTDLQYAPGQKRLPTRLTFYKLGPDKVRQLSEQSSDDGKTWTVNYDFIYLRRASHRGALPAVDRGAVLAALERYRVAWLANDRAAVLRTFADDPVLLPAQGGSGPVVGKAAILSYWWPAAGPATTITGFEQPVERVEGAGDFATAHGVSRVDWTTGADPKAQSSRSQWTALLRPGSDGAWRISALAWSALP